MGEVRYRGYVISCCFRELSTTQRIARPDGSWRYSSPTVVGARMEWQVFRESGPGARECVGVAASEHKARELVDRLGESGVAPDRTR